MDISEVNAENVDYLTFEELRSVVRQLFTENEWEHSSELNKTRYALLFSAYIKFEGFRQYYTLEQFVKGDTLKFTLPIPDRFSLPTHRDIGRPFYGPRRQPEATITSQDIRRDERGDVAEETASTIETRGRDGQSEEREGRTQENIDNGGERQHVPLPRAESIPQNIATGSHQSAQMIYGTNIQEYRHRTPIPVAQIETLYPFSRRDNVEYASHIDITGRPPAGAPNYPAYDDRLITRTKRGYRYASPHPLRREQQIGNYEGSGPMRNLTRSETYGWQRQRSPRSTRGQRHQARRAARPYPTGRRGRSAERDSSSEGTRTVTASVASTHISRRQEQHIRPTRGRRHGGQRGQRSGPYRLRRVDPSEDVHCRTCEEKELRQLEINRRFAIEQSIRREQSIQREEQLREFRQLQVNLRERGRRLAIQPSTSTTAKSNKPSASQSKPEETSRPVKEEGPYKILKKVQPKPVETKKPEPVPSTSGAIKKTNITILKRKGKKSYLQRPKLNLNTINPENVHQLSNLDILNVLRSYFTEEQWSNATPEHRIHLKNLFFTYIQNEQYRKRYTLGEFLREHVPEDTPAVEADVHRALGDTDIAKRTDIIPLTREESRQGFINLHHMRALARSRRDRIMILPSIPETEEEYESSEKSETDTVKESASKSESSTDDNEEEEENGEEEEDNDEVDEDDDDEVDEDDENEGNGDDDDDTDHGNADNALQKPTSVTHIVKKKISSLFPKK